MAGIFKKSYFMKRFLAIALAAFAQCCPATVAVRDDTGTEVRLARPAQRIVALSPNIAETLFAAGAGGRLVGTVDYSDYPGAAQRVPRVGSSARLDYEAIVALRPDLAIGWQGGNPPALIDHLRRLGIPVYLSRPVRIDDVARDLEHYGALMATAEGAQAAAAYRARLAGLRARYSARPTLRVFYEVWQAPLTTVGGAQVISDAIRLCGGENVFGGLRQLAPTITAEAVLAVDPDVIVASGMDAARPEWLDEWRRWPELKAVAHDNLFFVPPDLIQRHTPRLLEGAELLCRHLETARAHLKR